MYNICTTLCSSLEKIFSEDTVLPQSINSLTLLQGTRRSVQLAIRTNEDENAEIEIVSPLAYTLYKVDEIPAGLTVPDKDSDSIVLKDARPGLYPDLLSDCDETTMLTANKTSVFWLEFSADSSCGGECKINVKTPNANTDFSLELRVIPATLPGQTLRHINWFHTDCLSVYYNVPVFSEEYWKITENFAKNAKAHGVNVLFTPLFTPPLDTEEGGERPTVQLVGVKKKGLTYYFDFSKLDRWMEMAERIGFRYFEFSHFFTQWGAKHCPKIIADTLQGERKIFGWETKSDSAEYMNFLEQFGKALTEYTDARGITENCYVHCSDEPGLSDLYRYKKCATALKEYFGKFRQIDALSEYSFYKTGCIELPVPEEGSIEKFADKVPELWTYYCCGQFKDNLPNRFFALPSIKNRILGTLLYKYGCTGFLHWGFNFYFTQYSKASINPFEVTDADGAFSSGDSFVVYPGENGKPMPSLRQKVFYDGIQDFEALTYLESLTSRNAVLELIENKLGKISFTNYPLNPIVLTDFMDEVYRKIEEAGK